jgi:hypothetical protein
VWASSGTPCGVVSRNASTQGQATLQLAHTRPKNKGRVELVKLARSAASDKKSGAAHTTVRIPFAAGTGDHLHLNGTGCCTTLLQRHHFCVSSQLLKSRGEAQQPVVSRGLLDPSAIGSGAKVYKTQTIVSVVTATIPGWRSTSKVAEVQYSFDHFPQCALRCIAACLAAQMPTTTPKSSFLGWWQRVGEGM